MTETAETIISEIKALSSHYRRRPLAPADEARWLADFVTDLGELPLDAVRSGCAHWRRNERKFPTPGELRGACDLFRRDVLQRPRAEAWRELTDSEYDALSLRDKIRHREILAYKLEGDAATLWRRLPETKAGDPPSWRNYAASLADDWARMRETAAAHLNEAKRLGMHLRA